MKFLKSLFGNLRTRIWAIVTMVLVVLMVVVTALTSTVLYDIACIALGARRTVGRGKGSYYELTAANKQEAYENGNALTERICEEGFVLLKNEGGALPLAGGAKVSVFGKNSVDLVYGGTGSGGGNFRNAPTIFDSLEEAGFEVNPELRAFYEDDSRSGGGRSANPAIENSGKEVLETGETPQASYPAAVKESYSEYSDAAIVVLSRIGGEGFDLPRTAAGDDGRHYLELDADEQALIEAVTAANFGKVIVLINASTTIEAGVLEEDDGIDAVMSMGGMGFSGIMALGRLLNGEVSPSGRTVDNWAADFTASPVWNNFGNNGISGGNGVMPGNAYVNRDSKGNYSQTGYYYTDYEEGIYMGYRYYETRGYTDGEQWYRENVVYPFGYGLSYTDFSWEVLNADELSSLAVNDENKTDPVTIEVKVTNTGKVAGADVVQLYCDPPEGTLEKSSTVLVGFAKTERLAAGASEVVELSFEPYFAASYDSGDADGESGYTLEEGRYALRLKTDAHTAKAGVADIEFNVDDEVVFTEDPHNEGAAIENRFEGADDQLDTVLSRSDWEGTWPTRTDNRELDDELRAALASTEENNPNEYKDLPLTGQDTDLNAIDLRGLDYDAPEWEEFLNALTFQEMKDLFNRGAFKTYGIMRLNLPETVASDGPVGFTNFISLSETGNVAYASEYVLGSTWSTELAYAMGQCVGEEGAYGDVSGVATPYTGWYAPGLNLHRSPFGGRNFEYFSEDPYLSGFMAAAEIEGAQSKGLVTYMKHFALNEQETYREDNGVASWATEQAIRELYLRPFEIAVKYGEASGIMSSFNRIGTKWTGGDYVLLTDVLRGEWGFTGSVICDFNVNPYMSAKQMIYAGGDLNLTTMRYWMRPDETSAGDVSVLRRAAHNVLYSVINSNAMNGITENTRLRIAAPIWQIVLLSVEAAIVVGLAVWGFFEIRSLLKKQRAERAAQAAAQQTESGGGDDVLRPEIKNVNGGNE